MNNLTDRQNEVYHYIIKCVCDNGFQPSFRDIQKHFGFKSINAVRSIIISLHKKDLLILEGSRNRSLVIKNVKFFAVPTNIVNISLLIADLDRYLSNPRFANKHLKERVSALRDYICPVAPLTP